MKKIVVLQIPNSKNNGSAMMAINSISFYHKFFEKDVEFFCDFATQEDKKRIVSELDKDVKVDMLNLPKFNRGSNIVTSITNRIPWIKKVVEHVEQYKPDAILVLGGDDFSEYYSGYKIVIRLYLMYMLSLKMPVYLVGHTIGPFHSWRKKAFEILMKRCRIITRDKLSMYHCQNDLNHKHTKQGHDLAWFDLPMQSEFLKDKMIQKYNLKKDKFIVITPSALVSHYTKSSENYFKTWKSLVEALVQMDYQVVLMPHVFNNNKKDDVWAIKEIKKQVGEIEKVCYIEDLLLPSECRALVSSSYLSISCRMHAAVSTLQTTKPTIALSYSAKYEGVIGGDVGMPELIIEATNDNLWEDGLVKKTIEKVQYIKENYSELTAKISSRIEIIKKEESEILSEYGELIKSNNGKAFDE